MMIVQLYEQVTAGHFISACSVSLLSFFKETQEALLVVILRICTCVYVCVCTHLTSEPDVQFSWNLVWKQPQASPLCFPISCTQ